MSENWTKHNIPDLTGKVIIITGGNSGIGFEAAKEFARKGAQTILACRNMDKAETALAQIKEEIPNAATKVMHLDLSVQASVHQFVAEFKDKYKRLDVLVNNAGIMAVPYTTTVDGFESQFATNHLGHFALTGLLIDLLLDTPGSRVINVSSNGHRMGRMDFDNLMYEGGEGYSPLRAYGRSKLTNILFTYELQRRYQANDANAISVAVHPGLAITNLINHLENRWYFKLLKPLLVSWAQSPSMSALPTIRAAIDSDVKGGDYYGPGGSRGIKGYPVLTTSSEASHNEADARRLWQVSEELTGVSYAQLDQANVSRKG